LPLLLEPFGEELEPGLPLGELDDPEAAPPEVAPDELPLADDGLLLALEPAPALLPRSQPASARARDAARMASSFMNPPLTWYPQLASIEPGT
jgi:hypothetical protein